LPVAAEVTRKSLECRRIAGYCHDPNSHSPKPLAITPQQFEQINARLSGKRRVAAPIVDSTCRPRDKNRIIIGIDPSLRSTGYGVIQLGQPHPVALEYGAISCPAAWEHSRCLAKISRTLREIATKYRTAACAVEGLFHAQNLQTALIMGEARGAALAAVGEAGLEIFEIAPRKVKQALVGYGAAQKIAVAKMVQRLLRLREIPVPDAADALAVALAHSQQTGLYALTLPKRI
jgi:crossover junction endodeoxyribonuclease RuvC